MDELVQKAESLASEAQGASKKELREIVSELCAIVKAMEERRELNTELALAVQSFAEWQRDRYSEVSREAYATVGSQLCSEVFENVHNILGHSSPIAASGASLFDAVSD